ncbi:MAG: hypothetical protein AAGJ18_13830 [Bacteroidota bacterium]
MKKSKLFSLLQACNSSELEEIRQFLATPLFNTRQDILQLFEILAIGLEEKDNFQDKKAVFTRLFPHQKYRVSKMDLLMSYLYRLVQDYLAWKTFNAEESTKKLYIAKAFQQKGLYPVFEQKIDQLAQQQAAQPLRNAEYFQGLYQLQWEKFSVRNSQKTEQAEASDWALLDTLDLAYFANKLKQACLLKAHQQVYPLAVTPNFFEEVFTHIQQEKYFQHPAIHLYYHCYIMLAEPSVVSHFKTFRDLLFEYDQYFSSEEKRNLLLMGINYCVRQINEGQSAFLTDLFGLYEGGLTNNYLLENNQLSRFTFHNIVGTGLATNKVDWVATFVDNYKNRLPRKDRERTYSFSLARLAYHRKNYEAVLELLQKSNYRDLLLNLAAKTLLLKVYVETDEDRSLNAHLSAMEQFIRRKRVIGYHKTNYLNIVKYARKMRSLNFFDKAAVIEFKNTILSEKVLTERAWFLEQIDKL